MKIDLKVAACQSSTIFFRKREGYCGVEKSRAILYGKISKRFSFTLLLLFFLGSAFRGMRSVTKPCYFAFEGGLQCKQIIISLLYGLNIRLEQNFAFMCGFFTADGQLSRMLLLPPFLYAEF